MLALITETTAPAVAPAASPVVMATVLMVFGPAS